MNPYVNPYATWLGSPNFWPDRNGHSPNWTGPGRDASWTVLHITDCTEAAAEATLESVAAQRSAQYEIPENAELVADPSAPFGYRPVGIKQFVDEGNAAWHSGNGDMNENSDGIEHERTQSDLDDHVPFTMGQRLCAMWLVADIARRRNRPLTREYVIGHGEVAGVIGPIYGLGRGVTSTGCPDDYPIDEVLKGSQMFLAGQDPHALYVAGPPPVVTDHVQGVFVLGKVYSQDGSPAQYINWSDLTATPPSAPGNGQFASPGDQTAYTEAIQIDGVWYDRIVKPGGGPGDWALPDANVDTDNTTPADHRPAPPTPTPAPAPAPAVEPPAPHPVDPPKPPPVVVVTPPVAVEPPVIVPTQPVVTVPTKPVVNPAEPSWGDVFQAFKDFLNSIFGKRS